MQTEPTKLFTSSFSFSQVRSAGSGTETQLRISWDSVLNAQQTGRWWIVGSAWSGAPMIDNSQQKTLEKHPSETVQKALHSYQEHVHIPHGVLGIPWSSRLIHWVVIKTCRCGFIQRP